MFAVPPKRIRIILTVLSVKFGTLANPATEADRRTSMRAAERVRPIPELSMVALTHARECPGGLLPEGTRGAVVHAYRDGGGDEVEFMEPFHCVVTVRRDD